MSKCVIHNVQTDRFHTLFIGHEIFRLLIPKLLFEDGALFKSLLNGVYIDAQKHTCFKEIRVSVPFLAVFRIRSIHTPIDGIIFKWCVTHTF